MSKLASLPAYREDLALIHDAGFGAWARAAVPVLLKELEPAAPRQGLVIDLGCGSGILAEAVADAGYQVLGIDLSPAMIALARRRVPSGRFRAESWRTAKLPACVAVAAVGECVNYLFDPGNTRAALKRLFRRAHRALAPGGLLLFDAAGPGRASASARRAFFEGRGWAVLVQTRKGPGRLTRHITSLRRVGARYRWAQEIHHLRLYSKQVVVTELRRAGFRVRTRSGYGAFRLPKGMSVFLARK